MQEKPPSYRLLLQRFSRELLAGDAKPPGVPGGL